MASDLPGLLAELEQEWRLQNPGYAVMLADPASPDELADLRSWFGDLPGALVSWLAWHNGLSIPPGHDWGFGAARGLQFLSASDAFRVTKLQREMKQKFGGLSPWSDRWYPLFEGLNGDVIVLDCTSSDGTNPIHEMYNDGEVQLSVAPSLEVLVAWWVELHRNGVYWAEAGRWRRDDAHPLAARYPDLF